MSSVFSVRFDGAAVRLRRPVLTVAAALALACAAAPVSFAQTAAPGTPASVAAAQPIKVALIESLSGPFANTGEAVYRNIFWAMERVNQRGGVVLPAAAGGARPLVLQRYDSKGQNEEALSALRAAIDDGARVVMQGNSSATAAALLDAINKHNEREPDKRVIFLNYSAVDPLLTNEKCSFWHFRFDAHADMRMTALMQVVRADQALKSVYLIGQDYSFGQAVLREAKKQLAAQRPDVAVVGDELHPVGRVKDFAPYAVKIKSSGAQAVITGNWGNDLTLLVKAAREVGYHGTFYTSTAMRWALRRRWAMAASAKWSLWPTGCPTCRARPARRFTSRFASAFRRRKMITSTCACSSWSRRWRSRWSAPAAWTPPPLRARWRAPACRWPGAAVPCAPPTTSFSSRWWWA